MDWPVAESRLPVGSSASTIAGWPASARAIATRCRSPPDSWVGRAASLWPRPTRRQRRRGAAAPPGQAHAGIQQGVGDVVQRGGVLVEEKLLEHEPDRGGPQPGQLPVATGRPRPGR